MKSFFNQGFLFLHFSTVFFAECTYVHEVRAAAAEFSLERVAAAANVAVGVTAAAAVSVAAVAVAASAVAVSAIAVAGVSVAAVGVAPVAVVAVAVAAVSVAALGVAVAAALGVAVAAAVAVVASAAAAAKLSLLPEMMEGNVQLAVCQWFGPKRERGKEVESYPCGPKG